MGPRLFSRGNIALSLVLTTTPEQLQWGHDFSAVEMGAGALRVTAVSLASMGPRLFSRGNSRRADEDHGGCRASMGPRLFSRGNLTVLQREVLILSEASMGPRLFSRGNGLTEC